MFIIVNVMHELEVMEKSCHFIFLLVQDYSLSSKVSVTLYALQTYIPLKIVPFGISQYLFIGWYLQTLSAIVMWSALVKELPVGESVYHALYNYLTPSGC